MSKPKMLLLLFILLFSGAATGEWDAPTLDVGLSSHAPNVYTYEWNYTLRLQQCTKAAFCIGTQHSTTKKTIGKDEIFTTLYITKRWVLNE